MSHDDFQIEVLDRLSELKAEQAELKTDMKAVKEHLATLNGKVYSHERELAERRGAEKATGKWTTHLLPVVRYALGVLLAALAVLVLNHSSLFSTAIR